MMAGCTISGAALELRSASMLLARAIQLLVVLEALNKIPHGWLPPKLGVGLWISRFVLVLGFLLAGSVIRLSSDVTQRLTTIAMGSYFSLGFVFLLGIAETIDLDLFSTLLLYLGIVITISTRNYFGMAYVGMAIVIASFVLKIGLGMVWAWRKLRKKQELPQTI
jgi:hypothetical protein